MLKKADKSKFDQSFKALKQEYINKVWVLITEYRDKGIACSDTDCIWTSCKVCPLKSNLPSRTVGL
jgi:hypothetical protein